MKKILVSSALILFAASLAFNVYFIREKCCGKPNPPALPQTAAAPNKAASVPAQKAEKIPVKNNEKSKLAPTPVLLKYAGWDYYDKMIEIRFYTENVFIPDTLHAEITPQIKKFSSLAVGDRVVISGVFTPGQKYRIRIRKGLKNLNGGILESDAYAEIVRGDLSPDLDFAQRNRYLPVNGKDLSIIYTALNCSSVKVEVLKAYENNLNPYSNDSRTNASMMVKAAERTIDLKLPKNNKVYQKLDLENILGGRKPGVYRVVISSPGTQDTCDINVTDLGAVVAQDTIGGKIFTMVRSLSSGKPVIGASLTVFSLKNQIVASGVTDENGTAAMKFKPEWNRESDNINALLIKKGDDILYYQLNDALALPAYSEIYKPDVPRAFLFTERGIFRPGETFTAFAFIRKPSNGSYLPLKNAAVKLVLTDPYGVTAATKKMNTDEYGFLRCDFSVPETARSGNYRVNCYVNESSSSCGAVSINCSSYVPDRIKVTARCLDPNAKPSAPISYVFGAKYYFNAPLMNGTYRYRVSASPASAPAHWDSWQAGTEKDFRAPEVWSGSGEFNEKDVKLTYPGFFKQNGKSFAPIKITTMFHAAEPGGQGATVNLKKVIFPTDWMIGVRDAKSSKGDKAIEYTLLPSIKKESIVLEKDVELEFELTRLDWDYILIPEDGRVRREWAEKRIPLPALKRTVVIPKGVFKTDTVKKLEWDLEPGKYLLTVKSGKDFRTDTEFYHSSGSGNAQPENSNVIVFRTNAERYKPGETAEISFELPADGNGFLVTAEKEMLEMRTFQAKAGKNQLKIRIPENLHSSLCFVAATVVFKRNGQYIRMFGITELEVDQTARHQLNIGLKMPDTAVPKTEIPVELTLKDGDGKPASGMVCLYGTDSGVLSLTAYETPNIFARFFGPGDCPVSFHDMYEMIFEELKISPDGKIGGGDAAKLKFAKIKQKKTARLIAPPVHVPASGHAVVKLRLPDHSGAMKFYAVASSEDRVGSVMKELKMRNRISVMLSAPRFLAPGDSAMVTMTFFNHDANDPSRAGYQLSLPSILSAVGKAPVLDAKAVKKGAQTTLMREVKAGETLADGEITVKFDADSWKASDNRFITVRSPNAVRTERVFHILKPGEKYVFKPGEGYIGKSISSLRISSSPALGIKSSLNWLNEYPYGCLEQTAAGGFPFLALPVMEKTGLIDPQLARSSAHKPEKACALIMSMRLSDGSFAMWQGSSETWKDGSLFALHFLAEFQKISKDFAIGQKSIGFLRKVANDATPSQRAHRAYAVYILSLLGDEAFISNARNLITSADKPDFSLMLAGGALIQGGFASLGTPSLLKALEAECWRNEGVPTSFSDETCRLGMTLYIMMKCGVENPVLASKLAFELAGKLRQDSSAWGTTHANAWAALGLSAYAAKYPPVKAEVDVNGKRDSFEGVRTIKPDSPVTVQNHSKGNLLVIAETTGIPRNPKPSVGILEVSKEYLNADGKPVSSVSHGDLIYVRLRIKSPHAYQNIAISDLLPGGFEIENENFATRAAKIPPALIPRPGAFHSVRIEKRDDRFLVFGNTEAGKSEFVYQLRAVTRGTFAIPPLHAESMYQPDVNGETSESGKLIVK